ncbi:DUF3310 domain-containing protein [Mycobacterium avium]|uniref:DUF3310 domain-containing protein n=1 Tax=Mycobacterium avium TaxID=1764 RepID=UPI000B4B1411|nr:DUF3310 domain-containing protein [Mycobacterium avium]QBC87361.1 DUF3310 domain-containing protein [Mycobacterium avium subsp. hominissuis]
MSGQLDRSVDHPPHYTQHPSGVECITITEHMGFNLGNAVKYIWRADLKGDAIQDLEKAAWYISREIHRRRAIGADSVPGVRFGSGEGAPMPYGLGREVRADA